MARLKCANLPGVAENAAGGGDRTGDGARAVSDGQSGRLARFVSHMILPSG
jgi:hypothetical protein